MLHFIQSTGASTDHKRIQYQHIQVAVYTTSLPSPSLIIPWTSARLVKFSLLIYR